MYYAIFIREDSRPSVLYGPMPWDCAVDCCVDMVKRFMGGADCPDLLDRIENGCPVSDDYLESPYIIQAE